VQDLSEETGDSKLISNMILRDSEAHLKTDQKNKILLYEMKKIDGDNLQISYSSFLHCWVLGHKGDTVLLRGAKDVSGERMGLAGFGGRMVGLAREWFAFLEKAPVHVVDRLKNDLDGFCLYAELEDSNISGDPVLRSNPRKQAGVRWNWVGFTKCQGKSEVVPLPEVFEYLNDYQFKQPAHKMLGVFEDFGELLKRVSHFNKTIKSKSISNVEEGSVLVLIKQNSNEELLTSGMLRVRPLDYEILRMFRDSVTAVKSGAAKGTVNGVFDGYDRTVKSLYEKNISIHADGLARSLEDYLLLGKLGKIYFNKKQLPKNWDLKTRDLMALFWYMNYIGRASWTTYEEIESLLDTKDLMERLRRADIDCLTLDFTDAKVCDEYINYKNEKSLIKSVETSAWFKRDPILGEAIFAAKGSKDLLVIIPLSVPSSGKSYLKDKLGASIRASGMSMNSVNSDRLNVCLYEKAASSNPGHSYSSQELQSESKKFYRDSWEFEVHRAVSTKLNSPFLPNLLFIDKNHSPDTIKNTLSQVKLAMTVLERAFSTKIHLQSVVLTPRSFKKNMPEDVLPNYPLSIHYFLNCFQRLVQRKNHETLNYRGLETAKIAVSFFKSFQGYQDLSLKSLGHTGVTSVSPFPITNCVQEPDFETPKKLKEFAELLCTPNQSNNQYGPNTRDKGEDAKLGEFLTYLENFE
jgi:hypothetical protein